jgi:NAD(P)-dependent dehydrogenase (short-subunit alcohol dehydrogenase family)
VRGALEGKVALVTGASRGIGAAIARRLAAEGAAVAAVARSLDRAPDGVAGTLRETVAAIEADGGRAVAIPGDILDAASREAFMAAARRALGPLDILVNNATHGPYRPLETFRARDVALTLESSVGAPLHLVQLALPHLRAKRRGWILNISSATAKHPEGPPYIEWQARGGSHLYASGKAALDRLTTGLAAELYADGIAVNALAPVAAVITEGVRASGAERFIEPSMIEPVEAMAEAALALVTGDPEKLTGRIAYSLPLLAELGREIRTLDGRERLLVRTRRRTCTSD